MSDQLKSKLARHMAAKKYTLEIIASTEASMEALQANKAYAATIKSTRAKHKKLLDKIDRSIERTMRMIEDSQKS